MSNGLNPILLLPMILMALISYFKSQKPRPLPAPAPKEVNYRDSIVAPIKTLSKPVRIILPQGRRRTFPSNFSVFEYKGRRHLLVRYIFYKFDEQGK